MGKIEIKAVIGANFGDEGKGLMTDYYCHQSNKRNRRCIVVLSNGGSQRGHTVTTPDGRTHVFHHFGSGTFEYASTYLPSDYIINPMNYVKEWETLFAYGMPISVYVHPFCKWTTPYDMIVNQIVEEARDNKNHGSCGVGIWETEYRYNTLDNIPTLNSFNCKQVDERRNILISMRDNYFINRLRECGISSVPDEWKKIFYSDTLITNFINDCEFFSKTTYSSCGYVLNSFDTIVYENGQGLLLDQGLYEMYGDNLTPSNTGAKNVNNSILTDVFTENISDIELCYVSRTYMTRHGVGRFETECDKSLINQSMFDEHNLTNKFQGELRYGQLIEDNLATRIINDSKIIPEAKITVAFTHTNEHNVDYERVSRKIGNCSILLSDGKTHDSVSKALFR